MKAWAQDHEASKGSAEQLLHFGAGELKKREASKRTFLCSRLSGSWRPNPCQVLPSSEGWRQQGASQKVTLCPRQAQVNGYKGHSALPASPSASVPVNATLAPLSCANRQLGLCMGYLALGSRL